MKYSIKLTTFDTENTAEARISKALGFDKELSHSTLIGIFSETSINVKFSKKKNALNVAEKINKRGSFGGYGKFAVVAEVVAV